VFLQEIFITLAECSSLAGQPLAAADSGGARISPVIARTNTTAVEVLGAIIGSRRPFANDSPEGRRRQIVGMAASRLDMLIVTLLVTLSLSLAPLEK